MKTEDIDKKIGMGGWHEYCCLAAALLRAEHEGRVG